MTRRFVMVIGFAMFCGSALGFVWGLFHRDLWGTATGAAGMVIGWLVADRPMRT
jgi:1,4-dihydroxy-2-naphthoate octaprenyltransferase